MHINTTVIIVVQLIEFDVVPTITSGMFMVSRLTVLSCSIAGICCIFGRISGAIAAIAVPPTINDLTKPNRVTFLSPISHSAQKIKIPRLIFSAMLSMLLATILLLFFKFVRQKANYRFHFLYRKVFFLGKVRNHLAVRVPKVVLNKSF